jgi:hypothetical protein
MAFKFKDLMVNVTSGGGADEPICTIATMDPDPAAMAITCTVDTMDPAQAVPCTVATMPYPGGLRRAGGTGQGICTIATMWPAAFATVTTVTTVTTLVQAAAPGATSLAQLKGQLQQALADVERQEQAQALPATIEEADDLERKMESALQELRAHRRTLEKGAKKEPRKPRK